MFAFTHQSFFRVHVSLQPGIIRTHLSPTKSVWSVSSPEPTNAQDLLIQHPDQRNRSPLPSAIFSASMSDVLKTELWMSKSPSLWSRPPDWRPIGALRARRPPEPDPMSRGFGRRADPKQRIQFWGSFWGVDQQATLMAPPMWILALKVKAYYKALLSCGRSVDKISTPCGSIGSRSRLGVNCSSAISTVISHHPERP